MGFKNLKGQYVTVINDSKGFILYKVLTNEKNGKVVLENIKTHAKFPFDSERLQPYWLQKDVVVYSAKGMRLKEHEILSNAGSYYVVSVDLDGDKTEEYLDVFTDTVTFDKVLF